MNDIANITIHERFSFTFFYNFNSLYAVCQDLMVILRKSFALGVKSLDFCALIW